MFNPVDRYGNVWPTVQCLVCKRVFSIHHSLPVPRLPVCISHRKRKVTAAMRTPSLFPEFDA